jgi:hypothetical protein
MGRQKEKDKHRIVRLIDIKKKIQAGETDRLTERKIYKQERQIDGKKDIGRRQRLLNRKKKMGDR